MRDRRVSVYLDDILIYARTKEEHDEICVDVVKKLHADNLRKTTKRIQFSKQEVNFLGLRVNGQEIIPVKFRKEKIVRF